MEQPIGPYMAWFYGFSKFVNSVLSDLDGMCHKSNNLQESKSQIKN